MTIRDKLYSMKATDLIRTADSMGVPILCNKYRTQLKESRDDVIERILKLLKSSEVANG